MSLQHVVTMPRHNLDSAVYQGRLTLRYYLEGLTSAALEPLQAGLASSQHRAYLLTFNLAIFMYIFELSFPGTWLVCDDRERSFEIQRLLSHLEAQFFEANTALNLFVAATEVMSSSPSSANELGQWELDRKRRSELRREIEAEQGVHDWRHFDYEHSEAMDFEVDVRFKKERWSSGLTPRQLDGKKIFIYARAFLYALDMFNKFLDVLSKERGVPLGFEQFVFQMSVSFPNLTLIRNSAQHLDERAMGIGTGKKKLELKPISNSLISAPNGALVLDCLNGSKYGSIMKDGHYGEVDVSPASMEKLQQILQSVISHFKWSGPKRHAPS